ncbi:hypothetical protein BJV82DRAFT_606582 [Fennellomyces sp. T-0311]|nr:hypothetical protein BJV82DRAFT_606582 [Fennellomyces sp. T-0311]
MNTTEASAMSPTNIDIAKMIQTLHEQREVLENDKLAIQAQLVESTEKYSELANENDRLHKRIRSMQHDVSGYIKAQSLLETEKYNLEEELAGLRKSIAQLTREKNDLEKKLKEEFEISENSQMKWQQREEALCKQIHQLSQADRAKAAGRNTKKKTQHDKSSDTTQQPRRACSIKTSYERQISGLKQEIKQQELKSAKDMEEQQRRQASKTKSLEREIANMKQINQSLMEENEGYQALLREKVMSGEIGALSQDTPESIDGTCSNLAAELNSVSTNPNDRDGYPELNAEIKSLKDANRALQLYLNKILAKIIDNENLEYLLSVDGSAAPPSKPSVSQSAVPIVRKSFSSTMLSKILRRRQQGDQQIHLKVHDDQKEDQAATVPSTMNNKELPRSHSLTTVSFVRDSDKII